VINLKINQITHYDTDFYFSLKIASILYIFFIFFRCHYEESIINLNYNRPLNYKNNSNNLINNYIKNNKLKYIYYSYI
jgi:hypothetical protein